MNICKVNTYICNEPHNIPNMKKHEKFLEFNGKNIVFVNVDGTYWIALRPILDALNMAASRSLKNLKKDPILGPAGSIQALQVSKNGINQVRNMTCLPEMYIYGWIFSLRSESIELQNYKRTCYELLYNYFHGTITNRKELLLERVEIDVKINEIKKELKKENPGFKELQTLQHSRKMLSAQLNIIDKELVKQPELFN